MERNNLDTSILDNPTEYSYAEIREALADLLFRDNPENAIITVNTIMERARVDAKYRNGEDFKKFKKAVGAIIDVLDKSKEPDDKKLVERSLRTVLEGLNNGIGYNLIQNLFDGARKRFETEISDAVKKNASKMLIGIKPRYVEGVPVYELRAQTKNQADFTFLMKAFPSQYLTRQKPEDFYKFAEGHGRFSYSVADQNHVSEWFGKKAGYVVFGYTECYGCELLAATVTDGATVVAPKGRHAHKQDYLKFSDFMGNTSPSGYNEVVFRNPEKILPKFVLSSSLYPSGDVLAAAMNFDLPIVYVAPEAYKESGSTKQTKRGQGGTIRYNLNTMRQEGWGHLTNGLEPAGANNNLNPVIGV